VGANLCGIWKRPSELIFVVLIFVALAPARAQRPSIADDVITSQTVHVFKFQAYS